MIASIKIFLGAFLIIAVYRLLLSSVESSFAHNNNDAGFNCNCSSCFWLIAAVFTFSVYILGSISLSMQQNVCLCALQMLVINLYLISPYLRASPSAV